MKQMSFEAILFVHILWRQLRVKSKKETDSGSQELQDGKGMY